MNLHILFVCTGNICRSPTAERLAAAYASASGTTSLKFSSAGSRAVIAHPMHNEAAAALRRLGGDPSDFAARQLTPRVASEPDMILTMTKEHRDSVLELAPRQLRRTFTISEAAVLAADLGAQDIAALARLRAELPAGSDQDIPDPIGRDSEFYDATAIHISQLLRPIIGLCERTVAGNQPG